MSFPPSAAVARVEEARLALERARREAALAAAELESAIVSAAHVGASQREIARAAGCSQPYVSRLVTLGRKRFVPSSELGFLLAAHRREVAQIVARYGAGNVRVFGSVARGEDDEDSDVDLLIDAPDDLGLLGLGRLERELAQLLGAAVDVVPDRLLKDDVRRTAEPVPL